MKSALRFMLLFVFIFGNCLVLNDSFVIVNEGTPSTVLIDETKFAEQLETFKEVGNKPEIIQHQLPKISPNSTIIPEKAQVSTKYGTIEGFVYNIGKTPFGQVTANIFLGIPYAQPPIGNFRFEKPKAATLFSKGKLKATKFAPGCMSFAPLVGEPNFSEDCLYLNVFSPPKPVQYEPNGFPILVFIHGGGFSAGNTQQYRYKEFAANFVSRGIVVVTIQYRLAMFGFMSNGDKNMPGNLGLWDQRQALLWIQENIRQFGGDPSRVTLWGHNSGSANVGALSLSKWTRDLFSQTIEMSGSVFSGWAVSDSVVDASQAIVKFLHCPTMVLKKMKNCLKKKSGEEIAVAGAKLGWRRDDDINFARMQMRFDNDFFDKDFDLLLAEAPSKPTVLGINSQESMVFTMPFPGAPKNSSFIVKPENLAAFNRNDLIHFIKTVVVPDGLYGNNTEKVRNDVIEFYADRNVPENVGSKFYLTRYTQVLSDLQFNIPALIEVSKKSQENWPVFLYLLNYMNPKISLPAFGIYQTYEFPYLFGFSVVGFDFKFDEDDRKLQQLMVLSFAHFVITGNPSSQMGTWSPVNSQQPFAFFDMKPEPVLRDSLMIDRLSFWSDITSKYPTFDMIRGIKKLTQKPKNDF